MPDITARSFAEMLDLPAYAQSRILYEQKYPKSEPSVFKIPFYKPALDQIKSFYRDASDPKLINEWLKSSARSIKPEPKQISNIRVLTSFLSSDEATRKLTLQTRQVTLTAEPYKDVTLRLRYDLEAKENGTPVYIIYNFRVAPLEPNTATNTIQIAHWIMRQNGYTVPIDQIEYVDLTGGRTYKSKSPSKRVIAKMTQNAQIVGLLWNSI